MAVTMQQIAEESGVSQPTVSFIVNGRDRELKISHATRERVLTVARRLGYRRNAAAKAVATGRFGTVSLLQSTHPNTSYLPAGLLDGIHDALSEQGLMLMYGRLPDECLADEQFMPKMLQEWSSDGLLIDYINDIPERLIDLVEQHSVPAVWINSKHPSNCVYPDDFAGALDATRRLIALGHRRITYAIYIRHYTTKHKHYSEFDRLAGYEMAMKEAGLTPHVVGSGQNIPPAEAMAFTETWFNTTQRPTAVLAYGPPAATAVYVVAGFRGLSVPGDVSIACFESGDSTEVAGFGLSSMHVPQTTIGREAVLQLGKRIADPAVSLPPVTVSLEWNEGRTVGPCRATG